MLLADATNTAIDFHRWWGWVAIVANGVAGVVGLVAWRVPRLRGRWVWVVTLLAQLAIVVQIFVGAAIVSDDSVIAPRFHMFYGFVAFITIGLAYSYRIQMRGRLEMLYGFVGLFIMGLGIRAVMQVV